MEEKNIQKWLELKEIDSPMIKQYITFKQEHSELVVFFQVGEFFEIYCEDAVILNKYVPDVKITGRTVQGNRILMAGIPSHAGELYGNTLAKEGYSVVFIANRKNEENEVERFLDKIVTPGTITDQSFLEQDSPQYIMTVYSMKENIGVCLFESLNGEILLRDGSIYSFFDLVERFKPKEVRLHLNTEWETEMMQRVLNMRQVKVLKTPYFEMKEYLKEHREKNFENQFIEIEVIAAHFLMKNYLQKVQPQHVSFRPIHYVPSRDYMYLHDTAIQGLELFQNSQDKTKKGSLFDLLDICSTAKGSRMLKKWIQEPLVNISKIEARYQGVEFFLSHSNKVEALTASLSLTKDLERILGRLESGKIKDKELPDILSSVELYISFLEELKQLNPMNWILNTLDLTLNGLVEIKKSLDSLLDKEDIIAVGFNKEFDEVRTLKNEGLQLLENYVKEEKDKHKIKHMKLGFNSVLGYYFEVSKTNLDKVPNYFEEVQSLSNAKRYTTPDFQILKVKYLEALEQYESLYRENLLNICNEIKKEVSFLHSSIDFIALIDVLISFSILSSKYHFKRPILTDLDTIRIENGLHPLLMAFSYKKTIPNNTKLLSNDIHIITGPNMGGKSTYLKMVALLTIMAQIGCFVPARFAYKPVDRILLRMGANDSLLSHKSTFMMEMSEVSYILNHATENSLILMDELGRGTSTNDGIAIAKAVIHYIHSNLQSKTICSTHYHELISLENELRFVKNYHAESKIIEDQLELTYKIVENGTDKSFGIQVAKKAGLPVELIHMAESFLK